MAYIKVKVSKSQQTSEIASVISALGALTSKQLTYNTQHGNTWCLRWTEEGWCNSRIKYYILLYFNKLHLWSSFRFTAKSRGRWEGINWEIGTDTDTLLYIK